MDYLQEYRDTLVTAFPEGLVKEEIESLMALIHFNFSQRNLARLISETFHEDYHDMLNLAYGAERSIEGLPPDRLKEIRDKLKNAGWKWTLAE